MKTIKEDDLTLLQFPTEQHCQHVINNLSPPEVIKRISENSYSHLVNRGTLRIHTDENRTLIIHSIKICSRFSSHLCPLPKVF